MKSIVLLHAFPFDHRMWDEVADEIAQSGWQVFTPDFRGCGNAPDWTESNPKLSYLAEDVLKLMDNFGIEKFVVGGCSLGGYVAMELLRIAPKRIAGAIFVDTKASADSDAQVENRLKVVSQVENSVSTDAFWRAMLPNVLGESTKTNHPDIVEYTKNLMSDSRINGVINLQKAMSVRVDQHETIAMFSGPVLSIRGTEDQISSFEDHDKIMQAAQDGLHIEIQNCGHLAPIEKATDTSIAIIDFLNKISAPSC